MDWDWLPWQQPTPVKRTTDAYPVYDEWGQPMGYPARIENPSNTLPGAQDPGYWLNNSYEVEPPTQSPDPVGQGDVPAGGFLPPPTEYATPWLGPEPYSWPWEQPKVRTF